MSWELLKSILLSIYFASFYAAFWGRSINSIIAWMSSSKVITPSPPESMRWKQRVYSPSLGIYIMKLIIKTRIPNWIYTNFSLPKAVILLRIPIKASWSSWEQPQEFFMDWTQVELITALSSILSLGFFISIFFMSSFASFEIFSHATPEKLSYSVLIFWNVYYWSLPLKGVEPLRRR